MSQILKEVIEKEIEKFGDTACPCRFLITTPEHKKRDCPHLFFHDEWEFIRSAMLSAVHATVEEIKRKMDKIPRVMIGSKMVKVEHLQRAIDLHEHEFVDTCDLLKLLDSVTKK